MNFNLFLLENRTPPVTSNIAVFWRKGSSGYTANIDHAEQFSESEADAIIKSAEGSHTFIKWPVSIVHKHSFSAVNIDALHS